MVMRIGRRYCCRMLLLEVILLGQMALFLTLLGRHRICSLHILTTLLHTTKVDGVQSCILAYPPLPPLFSKLLTLQPIVPLGTLLQNGPAPPLLAGPIVSQEIRDVIITEHIKVCFLLWLYHSNC